MADASSDFLRSITDGCDFLDEPTCICDLCGQEGDQKRAVGFCCEFFYVLRPRRNYVNYPWSCFNDTCVLSIYEGWSRSSWTPLVIHKLYVSCLKIQMLQMQLFPVYISSFKLQIVVEYVSPKLSSMRIAAHGCVHVLSMNMYYQCACIINIRVLSMHFIIMFTDNRCTCICIINVRISSMCMYYPCRFLRVLSMYMY